MIPITQTYNPKLLTAPAPDNRPCMSTFYNGSICLTDIPKDKITEGKNGKKYLNVTLWVNDSPDQYGNIGSVQVSQTKEQREAGEKKTYIGNFKQPQAAPVQATAQPELSDLPF